MTRAITKEEFLASAPQTLAALGDDTFVIEQDGNFVAALVSQKDFEAIRRIRGQRAIAALNRLRDAIAASGATHQELWNSRRPLTERPERVVLDTNIMISGVIFGSSTPFRAAIRAF